MAKILIVDDQASNRTLLKNLVTGIAADYEAVEARSGKEALEKAVCDIPDIILLDIMMPEMDGFEVCHRLKADPKTSSIPILFITAMEEAKDKVRGFKLGASDYITKPFHPEEVKARIGAHLKLKEAEALRVEKENLKTMRDMVATYNHHMNQPLMAAYTYLNMLIESTDKEAKPGQLLVKAKKELDKINAILEKIRAIDKVTRTDYVGGDKMIDVS